MFQLMEKDYLLAFLLSVISKYFITKNSRGFKKAGASLENKC